MNKIVEKPMAIQFSRLNALPSLSTLLLDALQLLNSSYDSHALAKKIGQDPPMTAKILRIANSPFYGRARQIASLTEAIVLLGRNQINDLLLSVCFTDFIPTKIENVDYRFFWNHSIAVADCTRQLGLICGIESDLAFTAGLLHDIGRLIMITLYTEQYRPLFDDSASTLHLVERERSLLDFDHAQIGGEVAKRWNFPSEIQKAIEEHERVPSPEMPISLGTLIYTANLLIYQVQQAEVARDATLQQAITHVLGLLAVSSEQASSLALDGFNFADHIIALL